MSRLVALYWAWQLTTCIDDVKSGYRAWVMSAIDHYVKEVHCGGYTCIQILCVHQVYYEM